MPLTMKESDGYKHFRDEQRKHEEPQSQFRPENKRNVVQCTIQASKSIIIYKS